MKRIRMDWLQDVYERGLRDGNPPEHLDKSRPPPPSRPNPGVWMYGEPHMGRMYRAGFDEGQRRAGVIR